MPPVQLKLSWRTYSVRLVFTCGSLRPSQPAHVRRRGALVFSAADRNCATTPIARRPSETARHTANSSRMPIIFRTPLKTACIRPNSFPTQCRRLSMGAVGIAAVLQLWSGARRSSAALPHRRAPGFRFRQPIRLSDLEHSRGHSNERGEDRYSEGLSPRPVHRPFEAPRSIQAGRSLPAANGTQAVRAAPPQRGRGYHSWACGRPRIDAGLLRDLR
jgi:hypothetical protein